MGTRRALWLLVVPLLAGAVTMAVGAPAAESEVGTDADPAALCSAPLPLPSRFPADKSAYERLLGRFLAARCYLELGWKHDKQVRPTGPTIAALGGDPHAPAWSPTTWGTHNTVAIYYSPDVYRWMCERDAREERRFVDQCRTTCPDCRLDDRAPVRPIADGSMILKLMYGNMTAARLEDPSIPDGPPNMVALMVRDRRGSRDGWFWGSWDPQATKASQLDWPPPVNLPYPWMGFGYYCVNCHASAQDEFTFSSLNNVLGDPDTFLKYYAQDQPPIVGAAPRPAATPVETLSSHERFDPVRDMDAEAGETPWNQVPWPNPEVQRVSQPRASYSPAFLATFGARSIQPPDGRQITRLYMPPEVYDSVPPPADKPALFLTSDQCLGCHAAGSTGMHFDMTLQQAGQPAYQKLLNLAPYGEWRGSPMGLAGRDPIFFSQLESEETLHPKLGKLVQDLCLHCHGVMGQRQNCLDQFPGDPARANEVCDNTDLLGLDESSQPIVPRKLFSRAALNTVPYGAATPEQQQEARYGALARDGVSCTTCHHIRVDQTTPIGHTFTGDFRVGAPEEIHGPFEGPQQVPMEHTLGAKPMAYPLIRSSKVCGSCHSVVLPVFDGDQPWVRPGESKPEIIIEQATYPEWVFSDFRDDGATPRSCQDCHMASSYPGVTGPLSFKIASIQEASNMPQTENRRPESEIDLKPRSPFGRHTLVGLNVFFNLFAQQFPDILGIRIQDPMLGGRGVAPLQTTYDSMIQQADTATAKVSVTGVRRTASDLVAEVRVENLAGHKLPSGVGFRRAFLTFEVLDGSGKPLWVSGRSTSTGVLVDEAGKPLPGEHFWKSDCRPMTVAEQRDHFQPHYEVITRQDQAQIYQELVRDPRGRFTTSFLSLADEVKDNRLLPRGWEPSLELALREGLGSPKLPAEDLVERVLPDLPDGRGGHVRDPWYEPKSRGGLGGGGDALTYAVPLNALRGRKPAGVRVTLYYQSIPPFYLQDRFCTTPQRPDTQRLFFLAGHVDLDGTRAEGWKLQVVSSGVVGVDG
ncbi:MAG TPA: hypothetical protein VEL74_11715 [Thermoanaerobaculia bacterium]|nr:hypothetical protein [Thermoanaerobaculia bacterium]